jgi:hypothetical protein
MQAHKEVAKLMATQLLLKIAKIEQRKYIVFANKNIKMMAVSCSNAMVLAKIGIILNALVFKILK